MTNKQIFLKLDPNRKPKSSFHSFTEEEFEECLDRLIEEDRDVLLALGRE
jgi:hypothetical protein